MAGTLHRTATTAYPCYLPVLGEFSRSWPCKTCRGKIKELEGLTTEGTEFFTEDTENTIHLTINNLKAISVISEPAPCSLW